MHFVIAVDTQADFMAADGALSVKGADALVAPMRAWLSALEPAEVAGVLLTFDTHEAAVYAGSPEAEAFPIHCEKGTAGWANMLDIGLVDPAIPVWRLEKGVFDMWAQDGLMVENGRDQQQIVPREAFFADLKARGITQIRVIGVAADYCVRLAVAGLLERGFHVTVPAGLTRGIAREIDAVAAQDFAGASLSIAG